MPVTVVHPRSVRRCGKARAWLYADDSQEQYWKIAAQVPAGCRPLVPPGTFMSRVAATRAEFVSWVDRCLEGTDSEGWLTTPLYKNPHDNPLFLHYCWLREIDTRLAASDTDLMVVTTSSGLAAAIEDLCRARGVECGLVGIGWMALTRANRVIRGAAALVAALCGLFWRMLWARLLLGNAHRATLNGTDVLVDTYLPEQDLSDRGEHTDRYLPGLVAFYSGQRLKAAFYPLLYRVSTSRTASMFLRMKRSKILFAPFELYSTITDVFAAAAQSLRHAATRVSLSATGAPEIELRSLVEWHQPVTAMRAFIPLVMLRAPARLFAAGLRPRVVIDWYENQPIDKANQIGFHRVGCEVIAMRQYPAAPNYLSLYSTATEVRAGVSPRENWVCGEQMKNDMAIYDSVGSYRVVPALRYAHLYGDAPPSLEGDRLLILLPYSRSDAKLVVFSVMPNIIELIRSFRSIVIKPHHTMGIAEIRAATCRQWPQARDTAIEWEESPIGTLLPAARIVITAHSSAALEAVCTGKPVVVVGRTAGLAINALDGVDSRLWRVVYDAPQLIEATKQWSPAHPLTFSERVALGKRVRDAYFEPVTNETLASFMPNAIALR